MNGKNKLPRARANVMMALLHAWANGQNEYMTLNDKRASMLTLSLAHTHTHSVKLYSS